MEKYDQAIADLDRAIGQSPAGDYYWARGCAYRAKGDRGRAISDYTIALDKGSDPALTLTWMGITQRECGDCKAAIKALTQVIDWQLRRGWADYERGRAYYQNRQYDLAIADFTAAIDHGHRTGDTYRYLADSHFQKGEYESAVKNLDEALKLNPGWPDYVREREKAAARLRKTEVSRTEPSGFPADALSPGSETQLPGRSDSTFPHQVEEDLKFLLPKALKKKHYGPNPFGELNVPSKSP